MEKKNDKGEIDKFMMVRGYNVYNLDQVEGYTAERSEPVVVGEAELLSHADEFVSSTGAEIRHGGNHAFYQPSRDFISIPAIEQFHNTEGYYGTVLHELVHWTGHKSRLDRGLNTTRFGDEAYAFEELVAELGSAFLCAELSIGDEAREDHFKYLKSWLKVLKNDKQAIFTAASQAQKSLDFLHGFQSENEDEEVA